MRYLPAFEPTEEYKLMAIFRRSDLRDRKRFTSTSNIG